MNIKNVRKDQRGFILSGIALLLILPAILIASTYLVVLEEGGEAASIQSVSDKVFYSGLDIENVIIKMEKYDMNVNDSTLNSLEREYEKTTALSVNLNHIDSENKVIIRIKDPGGTAKYKNELELP